MSLPAKSSALGFVVAGVLLSASASAQVNVAGEEYTSGTTSSGKVFLGVRSGYALPFGASSQGEAMSDVFDGHVPIWLDLGYKVTPNVMLGLYGEYAFGIIHSASSAADQGCPSGIDCSGHTIRVGPQLQYRISPGQSTNPWVGLGVGYEWTTVTVSGTVPFLGAVDASVTNSGFEFANLQGGLDFQVSPQVGIGPFASFSFGQFTACSTDNNGTNVDCEIHGVRFHEWLTLGVRGAFEL